MSMSATAIPATTSSGQPVLILKEGSSQLRGNEAQRNNIFAARLIAEIVKSSLGPRGMEKMLVEISKTTDNEVGDGTTSAVVLAGALLNKAEELISKDVHPTIIVDGYRKAADKAVEFLDEISVKVKPGDKDALNHVARTSMLTKLVAENSEELASLVVEALLQVADKTTENGTTT